METIKAKGYEFTPVVVKASFNRKAVQFKNNIILSLRKMGISENYLDVPMEPFALKKVPASVVWYNEGLRMYYSYSAGNNFVENLYVVAKVIECEVNEVRNNQKTREDFFHDFSEDDDIEKQRKEARTLLGVSHDTKDLELINKKYKALAREHHPDTPTGDPEKFKAINHAHKMLRRELE